MVLYEYYAEHQYKTPESNPSVSVAIMTIESGRNNTTLKNVCFQYLHNKKRRITIKYG